MAERTVLAQNDMQLQQKLFFCASVTRGHHMNQWLWMCHIGGKAMIIFWDLGNEHNHYAMALLTPHFARYTNSNTSTYSSFKLLYHILVLILCPCLGNWISTMVCHCKINYFLSWESTYSWEYLLWGWPCNRQETIVIMSKRKDTMTLNVVPNATN